MFRNGGRIYSKFKLQKMLINLLFNTNTKFNIK